MAVRVGLGPGVVASRGQAEDAEDGAQLQDLASTLDGAEQSRHGIPGNAPGIEPDPGQPDESQEEADDSGQDEDSPAEPDQLELELGLPHAEEVKGDHVLRLGPQPPRGCGPRDTDFSGDTDVAGPLDQMPQAVVVDSLLVLWVAHGRGSSHGQRPDQLPGTTVGPLAGSGTEVRRGCVARAARFRLCAGRDWATVRQSAGRRRLPTQ
jgi:hypothetical protein